MRDSSDKKKEKNIKDFTTHRWEKFIHPLLDIILPSNIDKYISSPSRQPRPNNLQRLFPGPREWREGRVAEKKEKKKKTCTYDLDQPKRWHMQRRKRASSPVASVVASWFDTTTTITGRTTRRHHHYHRPWRPPGAIHLPCLSPSSSSSSKKPSPTPLPTSLAIIRPRFPPSASLRSTLRPISLRHSWSTNRFAGEGEEEISGFCERLIVTWMISWEVDGVEMDCGAIVDGCCPKRKDRRIDLLDTEIEVIISVYYFS